MMENSECTYCTDRNRCIKYEKDENIFKEINSFETAYLLGWIGSDGNILRGFTIEFMKVIANV